MSNLTPCLYCHRLYSKYSLNLHQPKCFDNPNSKIQEDINNLQNKNFTLPNINDKNGKRRKKTPLNRSKSSSSNENKNNKKSNSYANIYINNNGRRFSNEDNERGVVVKNSTSSTDFTQEVIEKLQTIVINESTENVLDRPGTQTLYSSQENCENHLMCFICGIFCESHIIKTHQEQCLIIWETIQKQLPLYIRSTPPKIVNVPSVDGTINITRHNQLAEASYKKCQKTKCNRCGKLFNFSEVLNHECQRFEPNFELYF
uniref:C2H2-type domain-containing protein n=1 Tax=Strongyloides venezuelensis TaxID=75913 RepID=A0A0K0F5K1_STRVS